MASTLRKVVCPGYDRTDGGGHVNCSNTLYEATYTREAVPTPGIGISNTQTSVSRPIWKCTNCRAETPRHSRKRRSNKSRAHDAWRTIRAEWQETNDALDAIVKAGAPSGRLLVHSSTFNHHLDKLLLLEKPSNFDVQYHTAEARKDLERAKQFVAEKKGEL